MDIAEGSFICTVDYGHGHTYKELEKEFDWVWEGYSLTEIWNHVVRIPTDRFEEVALEVIHFDRVLRTENVLSEFQKRGLRPANIEELLAFAKSFPELQRQHRIIALGSVLLRDRLTPFLSRDGDGRILCARHDDLGWLAADCFLGVLK